MRLGVSEEYAPQPAALSVVLAVSPGVVVACSVAAGAPLPWWLLLLTPLGILLVPHPGTAALTFVQGVLVLGWSLFVPGPVTWWAFPAAASLLVGHAAAALLSGAPPTVTWAASTRRRWWRRTAVVLAVTLVVAAAVDLVHRARLPGSAALTVLALVAACGWLVAARSDHERGS
ncbi:MAG: hypothetical protein M3Y71_04090 [Actinomycetota bacterium]|nr:hypothetical protein [Actinomycetota bacterium]